MSYVRRRDVDICIGVEPTTDWGGEPKTNYRFITLHVNAASQQEAEDIVQARLQKLIDDGEQSPEGAQP